MTCEAAFRMHSILQVLYIIKLSVSVPMLQVREALTKKVSRERVGAELEGMFNGEDIMSADFAHLALLRLSDSNSVLHACMSLFILQASPTMYTLLFTVTGGAC